MARLLLLNHNLRDRGTYNRALHLARRLADRGHAVTLWTAAPHHYYRPRLEVTGGLRIVETPSWAPLADPDDGWGPLDVLYRSARALLEPCDLAIAFAHPPNVALPAWLLARLRRRPLLYDWCDWYEGGIFPKRLEARARGLSGAERPLQARVERADVALERRMPRLADAVSVISERLRQLALDAGVPADRIHLLPNGANLDGIRPLDRADCRRALGLPAETPLAGYVANYHPDQELLLGAFARAAAAIPGLALVKTGPPFAGALVDRLGLGGRVIDLGFVATESIPLILGAADALLLPLEENPSNEARVPYKFTDYLAAGRPVATCRVGDLVRYFDDSAPRIGLAGEATDEGFAAAISGLFAAGFNRQSAGQNARALAEREFDWAHLTADLESFLIRQNLLP